MLDTLQYEIEPLIPERPSLQELIGEKVSEERYMDPTGIVIWLIIGAIAGWLAGVIMKGYGFGLIGNIIVGIVGAVVAGWILPRIGISIGSGFVPQIINAVIGAVILLFIIGLIRR